MLKVISCITVQHDWGLVAIAAFVCILISYESVAMFNRAQKNVGARKLTWLAGASIVTGAGAWATHFIAMLAYDYQIERGIDGLLTLTSGLAGVALSAVAYYAVALSKSRMRIAIGGVVLGGAISALHYIGMTAYSASAMLIWDPYYIIASVVLCVLFSTAFFWALFHGNSEVISAAAPIFLTLSVVLLHFTGMTALTIVPTFITESTSLIIDKSTVTVGVVAISASMTFLGLIILAFDNKLAHQQARDADALRALNSELESALAKAESSAKSKADFLANMSHEIRTPMNGIIGMTEVLLNTELNDHQRESAHLVLSSANGLMTVLNDILDFSKLESGKMKLILSSFNLRQLVEEVVATMQAHASAHNLELIVRYSPSLPEGVVGDEGRLRQILTNLVGNAVKFTEHGHVYVNVDGQETDGVVSLLIEIEDTGIGISQDKIEHIFEKFEQVDNSRSRRYEGTGLGLAISKDIVELMDGSIGVRSILNEGSTFWIKLTLPEDDCISASSEVKTDVFSNLRVLAVDDNYVNRQILRELLTAWGVQASILESGKEAFAALESAHAQNKPFQLFLTDYHMPDENGDQLTRRIQQDGRFKNLICVMLSSVDAATLPEKGSAAQYAAWVTKPIRASRLMNTMMQALNHNSAERLSDVKRLLEDSALEKTDEKYLNNSYILIAEDNFINQSVLKAYLSKSPYEIVIVGNGLEAVEAYQKRIPELILMDVSMPVMNGLSATEEIRRIEEEHSLERTPIIASTAHVLEQERIKCIESGMDDFITKPIRQNVLIEILQKWIGTKETPGLTIKNAAN